MKTSIVTALLLVSSAARAEAPRKTFCAVAKSELAQSAEMHANQFYTLDTSGLADEGTGRVEDLGEVGAIKVNLNVYVTDKEAHELTLQLDEQKAGGGAELLASTVLNPEGLTELTYRAPGSTQLIFVGCQLVTDEQIEALRSTR